LKTVWWKVNIEHWVSQRSWCIVDNRFIIRGSIMTDAAEWQCIHTAGAPAPRQEMNTIARYMQTMLRVLACDSGAYNELAGGKRLFATGILNLTVLGLLYGMTSAGLSSVVLGQVPSGGEVGSFSTLAVTVVGLLAVYLLLGAAALVMWVSCRGLGGRPQLSPHYLNMSVACIALWPAAPAVACLQVGLGGFPLTVAAAGAGLYGVAAMISALKAASGLSNWKMAAALIGALIYSGCFLYLWI
jgi:hypothetical protein